MMLNVCLADTRGRQGKENEAYPQSAHWLALLEAADSVDAAAVISERKHKCKPGWIPEAIRLARLEKIDLIHEPYRKQAV